MQLKRVYNLLYEFEMFNGSFLYRKLLTYASADKQPLLGRTRDQLSEVNNHRQNFILFVCVLFIRSSFVCFGCFYPYFFTRTTLSLLALSFR